MIRPVSYVDILDAPNASELLNEYAEECVISDHDPQRDMYRAMHDAGILHCFGFFDEEVLVGFVTIISTVMPHNGKKLANIESIFLQGSRRGTGAGLKLIEQAEKFAKESGSVALLYCPRIGSRMAKILDRRNGVSATHTVYTRWFK